MDLGGLGVAKFSELVLAEMRPADRGDRWRVMDAGQNLIRDLGALAFSRKVLSLHSQTAPHSGPMIVDGVRHLAIVEALRKLASPAPFILVHVDASPEFRKRHLRKDGITTDADLQRMDAHPTEREVSDVAKLADISLRAESGVSDSAGRVVQALQRLRQIADAPQNDEDRLKFAETLGPDSPRAKFVRMQIDRLRLRKEDPRGVAWARALRDEERVLEDSGRGWTALLNEFGVERVAFHRGFIEEIEIGATAFIDRAPDIFRAAPIRHLQLNGKPGEIRGAFRAPQLRQLDSLNVSDCDLTDGDVAALADSPHLQALRWLDVSYNRITAAGIRLIAGAFRHLQYVNLAGNPADSPTETYGVDAISNSVVRGSIALPRPGRALEEEFQRRIEWLHAPSNFPDYPPMLDDLTLRSR
jgi:hypothetical protein